jgi:iron complex outermembrane receptor protein
MGFSLLFTTNFLCCILGFSLRFTSSFAQNLPDSLAFANAKKNLDSARFLPAISVIGSRPADFSAGIKVVEIDSKLLKINPSANLSNLLEAYSPAYIRNYGAGMLATISLRGTSSNHTAVLWNGLNINQPTLGQSDFAILPIHQNTNITVRLGAASANYGTAAIGGAVLLSSSLDFVRKKQVLLQQEMGSFGLNKTDLQLHFAGKKMALQTTFYQNSLQNDFEFTNITKFDSPTEKQTNAAIRQFGFTQDLAFKIGKASKLTLRTWYTDSYRQIQAPMASAAANARQEDKNLRLMAEYFLPYKKTKTIVRTAFFNDYLVYTSDNTPPSHATVQTLQAQIENTAQLSKAIALQTGADVQHFAAQVDGYGKAAGENRASFFALFRYNPTYTFQITANLRQAIVEGFSPPLTPSLGLSYQFLKHQNHVLTFKTNAAASYRVPTLNERFWNPGGNPNLKPEQGFSVDLGLQHQFVGEKLDWTNEVSVYNNLIDNWIVWKPNSIFWYPDNLLQVQARGLEVSSKLNYSQNKLNFLCGLQYQYTQSTQIQAASIEEKDKQLAYVPLHTGNIFGLVKYKKISLNLNGTYTGKRFTIADNSDFLQPYFLTNLALGYQTDWRILKAAKQRQEKITLCFWLKINNLTNETYQNMAFRAMPLRNYAVSLQIGF